MLSIVAALSAQPALAASAGVFQTSVTPQAGEQLAAPCRYELTLMDRSRPLKGVWVIFERGRDMLKYYQDPEVRTFAQRRDFALMMPYHCAATSDGDMNVDPARGIGRALLAALTQLAQSSGHAELASAKMILLGFSGAGALVGRFPEYAPDRVLAVIAAGPGQSDPLGVDTIALSAAAAAVPQLLITGSADAVSGTPRPYAYFRKYFDRGAPWTFIVQNRTPHCCIINAKALVLEWLDAVVVKQVKPSSGWYGFITTAPSETENCPDPRPALVPPFCHSRVDTWGNANWTISAATIDRTQRPPRDMLPAGWLPTGGFAGRWRSFVLQAAHPLASMP
jgi:hypothetical protein